MPKKIQEYEEAKGIAQHVVAAGLLLFKIVIFSAKITVKGLSFAVRSFLRSRDIHDVGISHDPDGDGIWLWRSRG